MVISPRILSLLELAAAVLAGSACGRSTLGDAATFEACTPGSTTACYSGPSATRGVGNCTSGIAICLHDGSAYGPCTGDVLPSPEVCGTAVDESCDGLVDEGCACVPGSFVACYEGPDGTMDVGVCRAGTQECLPEGASYGPCVGGVLPSPEVCGTAVDESCDGLVDEGCACVPGSSVACYDGPDGTLDVGVCRAGTQECLPNGASYGPCLGEVLPAKLPSDGPLDEDCDGKIGCTPGTAIPCYDGPAGTEGVGSCKPGKQVCLPSGSDYGPCQGEVLPDVLSCDGPADETCNGDIDACTPCVPGPLDPACQSDGCFAGLSPTWNVAVGPPPEGYGAFLPHWLSGDVGGNIYFANRILGPAEGGCLYFNAVLESIHRYGADASEWEQQAFSYDQVATCAGGGCTSLGGRESRLAVDGRLGIFDFNSGICASQGDYSTSWYATLSTMDVNGQETWNTAFPFGDTSCFAFGGCSHTNATDVFSRIAMDSLGSVVLAGHFLGDLDLGGGPLALSYAGYVAKFDPTGPLLWSVPLDLDPPDAIEVATDAAGNIYVATPVEPTETGACGLPASVDPQGYETAVLAFSPDGNCLWAQRLASRLAGNELLAVDSAGQVVFAGKLPDGSHAITKLGTDGLPLWTTPLPATPTNVRFDAAGNVVVLGAFASIIDLGQGGIASVGGVDVWVARYDSWGSMLCGTRWGTPDWDRAGISFDPLGNTLVWFSNSWESVSLFKYPPWP